MTCREFQNRVSAYLEGEQNEDVRRLMGAHLAVCPGCAEAFHGVRGIQAGLGRLPKARLLPDFNFALRGKLLMEAKRSRSPRARAMAWLFPTLPRTALSGALAVVVLVGLALTFSAPHRPSLRGAAQKDAGAVAPLRAQEIPNHYVLERIPALPHRGVAIASRAYKNRSDSLSAPHNVRTASVQYVRF